MRLRQQLLLLTLGPLLAASFAVALLVRPAVDRLLVDSAEHEARQQLALQSLAIEAQLREIQARLDAYATYPAIRDGTPESIARTLIPLRAKVPGIDVLNFIATDGTVRRAEGGTINVRERYYFPDVLRGVPVVTKVIVDIDRGIPEVLILRPVRDAQDRVKGAVGASLRLTDVVRRIGAIALTHPGFVMLVDADGRPVSGAALPGITDSLAAAADTVGAPGGDGAVPSTWRAMLARMRSADSGTARLAVGEDRYRVQFRRLAQLDWWVAIGVEEDALYAPLTRVSTLLLATLLALVLLAVVAAQVTRARVLRPIEALSASLDAVGRGDLAARAPVPAQPELAEFAVAFNRMADDLQEQTRRRAAEEADRAAASAVLAEREAMFIALFNASPSVLGVYRESDGRWLRVNAAFCAFEGTVADALLATTVDARGPVRDAGLRATLLQGLRDGAWPEGQRLRREDASGRPRDLLVSLAPFTLDGERLVFLAGVDISELVRLEEQLRQAQKLDVVGRLAGGVAHDFNNMLTGILGASDLLGSQLPAASPLHEDVRIIQDSARRAASLTYQLLTFSRVQPATMQPTDLHATVRAAVALARRTFDRKVAIEEALEAASPWVLGDLTLLQTVVMNLLVNARDAMPEGGRVRVGTTAADGTLVLTVADTGHGMPPEVASRIFEPFFTTKSVGKGTGLGLSVAFGIVREHGGTIAVESRVDAGTTFTVRLPLAAAAQGEARTAESPSAGIVRAAAGGRLLLVDDEALVRAARARALRAAGHEVLVAEDGPAALRLLEGGARVDLAVLDLTMPGMDGLATLRALRAVQPALPAIVCSGYAVEGQLQRITLEPDVEVLAKPFSLSDLTARVARRLATPPAPPPPSR